MMVENAHNETQAVEDGIESQTKETLLNEEDSVSLEASKDKSADLEKQLEEVNKEVGNLKAQLKDQYLRTQAEIQNTKRRATQDVEKAHKFALDKFVDALIPVVDSLEKGIESAEQTEGHHEAIIEGMNLTLKQFLDTLARFDVVQNNPEGQPFDPNFHQAMSMVPNTEVEPNTVLNVFQKGYTLHGRVVRPAMVVVSK